MNPIAESSMVNETLVDDRSSELDGSSIDQRLIEHAGANKSIMGRLVTTLMLVVVLIGGGVFGLYKMRVDIPALNTPKIYAYLDSMGVHAKQMKGYIVGQYESYFHKHEEEAHQEQHKIVVTSPQGKGRHHHPAICLPDPLAATHRCPCLGERVSRGDHGQGGPGGEEGRCDVQDPANSLQGKAGRRGGREPELAQLEFNYTKKLADKTRWSLRMR